ncbi:MAG: hypothetical protein JWM99_4569 [Verrucomicrobiales bacterium]|nr:hypothetical protein [Verrucomicrobiales bacterium]
MICWVGLRFLDLILHAVAFTFNGDGLCVVQKAVEDGRGERGVVVKYFDPVFIGLIGGEDGGSGFIALAEDLEEQIGADFVDGQIPEFIDQEDVRAQVFLEFEFEAVGGLGRGQSIDDINGGGEQCGMALQTAFIGQSGGQMGFADHAAPGMMGTMPGTGLCRVV